MSRPVKRLPSPHEQIGEWAFVVVNKTHILGEGQSGTVFRVRNVRTGQLAAMKMHCGPCTSVDDERFCKERSIYADQPIPGGMPHYYGEGRWEGVDYFVIELVEMFDPYKPGTDVIRYFIELTYVYEGLNKRYLHLDGKRSNLAVRNGHPVLIDYSCSVSVEEGLELSIRTGTRKYRSPEAREGRPLTLQSDIYMFGVVLRSVLLDERDLRIYGPVIDHATANELDDRASDWEVVRTELKNAQAKYLRCVAIESHLPKFKVVSKAVVCGVGVVALVAATLLFLGDEQTESHTDADESLGLELYQSKDIVRSRYFLRRAAESGTCTNGLVFYELADIYARGRGVRKDRIQAISYAQRAFDLGYTNALPMLRRLKMIEGATAR